MSIYLKKVDELDVRDLERFHVWEYTDAHEWVDETVVRPIAKVPVRHLNGRVVGTRVVLANQSVRWAVLSNIDSQNARLTKHFLTLSILGSGGWFTMARYHDIDAEHRGPDALAAFVGLAVDEVFPIKYDVTAYCKGDRMALVGTIDKIPRERLTRAEIIALAVPSE